MGPVLVPSGSICSAMCHRFPVPVSDPVYIFCVFLLFPVLAPRTTSCLILVHIAAVEPIQFYPPRPVIIGPETGRVAVTMFEGSEYVRTVTVSEH